MAGHNDQGLTIHELVENVKYYLLNVDFNHRQAHSCLRSAKEAARENARRWEEMARTLELLDEVQDEDWDAPPHHLTWQNQYANRVLAVLNGMLNSDAHTGWRGWNKRQIWAYIKLVFNQ